MTDLIRVKGEPAGCREKQDRLNCFVVVVVLCVCVCLGRGIPFLEPSVANMRMAPLIAELIMINKMSMNALRNV